MTLPHGWAVTSLEDICAPVLKVLPSADPDSSFRYIDISSIDNRRHAIVSPQTLFGRDAPSRARQSVRAGDVLFSTVRTYLENIALVPSELDGSVASTGFCVLRPADGIAPKFIFYGVLRLEFLNGLAPQQRGTSYPAVRDTDVKAMPFPLAPTAEQPRIVAAIEEQISRIDAGVEALQLARRNLERMRAAVLHAAVTGRLVSPEPDDEPTEIVLKRALAARREALARTGRAYFEPAAPNLDGAPDLPASWTWASLDALAEIVGGVTKDAKREMAPSLVEVPYLRVANVQRGYLDLTEIATIRVPRDRVGQLRLLPGDILFTEGGDRDKLGRGWIWEGQIDPCIHQNHIFRARLYSAQIDPRFVSWHGNTFGQAWFVTAGKQTTNLASVSLNKLKRLPVPVPPPSEQRRIVSEVERQTSLIENLSQMVEMSLHRAGVLRSSVLQAAFEGRLVARDPLDEPASSLLERITGDRVADDFKRHRPLRRSRR